MSINRIWYLFKMQWVENRKLYVLGLLAMMGIEGLFYFTSSSSPNNQEMFFTIGLLLSSSIFTSTILSRFTDKRTALSALMLPASAFEKILVAIIYSLVIFPVVYTLLTYPVMFAAYYYHTEIKGDLAPLWNLSPSEGKILIVLMLYFMLQAFVMFCSTLFRRLAFVKTAVLVCAVLFGTVALNDKLQEQLYKNHLQPNVLPKGFIPNPPDYATQTNTKTIYPPKGSTQQPVTITSAPKKVLLPPNNFNVTGSGIFMPVQFYARNTEHINNPLVWQAVLPAWQQFIFALLFFMMVPFFWLLTWVKLREKTLI
ncbi:hypothetical protein KXQ82_18435 [Mucilaginibacter sp. HMF5004]|uniref:hypothetical protein n=1 Tax=Mucilaginibacter rivuli TaxID=2857527 RepID=UPI001C5DF279|nr:hypothetical protein [Mucilaginibacter rivuli]MBW4891709.1 hypothetical protein [Mucilaginibacter rivuli]